MNKKEKLVFCLNTAMKCIILIIVAVTVIGCIVKYAEGRDNKKLVANAYTEDINGNQTGVDLPGSKPGHAEGSYNKWVQDTKFRGVYAAAGTDAIVTYTLNEGANAIYAKLDESEKYYYLEGFTIEKDFSSQSINFMVNVDLYDPVENRNISSNLIDVDTLNVVKENDTTISGTFMIVGNLYINGNDFYNGKLSYDNPDDNYSLIEKSCLLNLIANSQNVGLSSDKIYEQGKENGYNNGYNEGFDVGNSEGFEKGYNQGYLKGKDEATGFDPIGMMVSPVAELLNIKLFGEFSIGNFFTAALFVMLAIAFMKLFAGG